MSTFEESHVGARVYNSGNITLGDAALTALTFDSERYDNDSIHSTVSNTSRLTCQTDGKYLIGGHVRFDANATGYRLIQVYLNGTTQIASLSIPSVGGVSPTLLSICTDYDLSVGDYVELRAYQNSSGNLDVTATGNHSPEFWMRRVG